MLLRAASVGCFVLDTSGMARALSAGTLGMQRGVVSVQPVLGEASPSHCNPRTGKGNDAGLKKACVVFISYIPNDVFWIALLRG